MRRRAMAVVATQGISPVMAMLVALVIALILLLAAPVKAQETTTEETTVLAADAADMKVEAETDNTSVKVDKDGEVSVSTDDGSSSDDGTSQQSSMTVQQNQTDEGSGSRASTGDVNIGATRRNNSSARVEVDVLDEDGDRTGDNFIANGGNDVTETIPEGRGFFSLDITADNASYNITVEDCDPNCNNPEFVRTFTGRDDQRTDDFRIFGNSFRLRIETDRVDGDRNRRRHHDRDRNRRRHRHHDRDRDRDRDRNRFFGRGDFRRGAADQQYRSERIVEERVIRETIPDKGRLAATGGVPLTGAAFLALASVGLGVSILRFAIRRDP